MMDDVTIDFTWALSTQDGAAQVQSFFAAPSVGCATFNHRLLVGSEVYERVDAE